MKTSECTKAISEALAAAQADFKPVQKSGKNKHFGYRFSSMDDYREASQESLAKHGLSIVNSIEEIVHEMAGRQRLTRIRIAVRIIHRSGEWFETTMWGEGEDAADKSIYKAVTGARKYGLASALNLSTQDDPEADSETDKRAEEDQQKKTGQQTAQRPQQQQRPAQQPTRPPAQQQSANNAAPPAPANVPARPAPKPRPPWDMTQAEKARDAIEKAWEERNASETDRARIEGQLKTKGTRQGCFDAGYDYCKGLLVAIRAGKYDEAITNKEWTAPQ